MGDFILFQNVIISILLFANFKIRGNAYLAFIFLLNAFQGFSHQLVVSRTSIEISAILFLNTAPISFLLGPCLYFYTKTKLDSSFRLRTIHLVHLLPVILCLFLIAPYLSSSFSDKLNTVQSIRTNQKLIFNINFAIGKSSIFFFSRPIFILGYVFASLRLLIKNKTTLLKAKTSFQSSILKKWLEILLYSFAIIYILNLMNVFFGFYLTELTLLNPFSFLAALSIGFLTIQIFINPYILYGFNNVKYYSNDSFLAKLHKTSIVSVSLLDEKWKSELILKIESNEVALRVTEKGYNLAKMSEDLDFTMYHLNYYFKEIADESFTEFKNRKRIELAIQLINDDYLSSFTVENLSLKCGFSSRSNFNNAFLRETGKNLKEFKKTVK